MDRKLLEEVLSQMKVKLKEGTDIGNLKVGALFALGSQLEALFYFQGHELASHLTIPKETDIHKIVENLKTLSKDYHLGEFNEIEVTPDHITFTVKDCGSCRDFPTEFKSNSPFCSFESGLYAGIVEKMCGKHCFAQELSCKLQGSGGDCQFMIVIPSDD